MRLDNKREKELRRRQGTVRRTLLQFGWLLFSFVAAYFIANWLFNADHLAYTMFYNEVGLPRTVPEWAIQVSVALLITMVIQFTVMLGYMLGNPQGRARSGQPSGYSKDANPYER